MLRARRLASAVVVASLAVGGLSACRAEPSVAAYIGENGQVTEQRVQEVWDEVHDELTVLGDRQAAEAEAAQRQKEREAEAAGQEVTPAPTVTRTPVRMPISRADVVSALVGVQVYGQMARQAGVSLPDTLPYEEQFASQNGLPPATEYTRLATRNILYRQQLGESVTVPARPTEEDLRTVYDRLAAGGQVEPGQDFAAWSSAVSPENLQAVARAGAFAAEVEKTVQGMDIDVNPRYQPLEFDLLSAESESGVLSLLGAEVGEDLRAPVVDAP